MPTSKNGKLYYTKEQYQAARYSSNALDYALSQGYDLVREGRYYHMREHDSMIFTPQGAWFWNSRGVQGSALEFMIYYEGKTLTEAVLTLARDTPLQARSQTSTAPPPRAPEAVPFTLPQRAGDFRRIFAYLCKSRCLTREVVMEMTHQKILYEGISQINGKELHNAVFVYRDPHGKAVGAFCRGLNSDRPYKGDVPGSCKDYGWLLRGKAPRALCVFEAAIDAASHACLEPDAAVDRLSLEGLSPRPLWSYLEEHPDIRDIRLMLDGDAPGQAAAKRLEVALTQAGYTAAIVPPAQGKDYNEQLQLCIRACFGIEKNNEMEC